MKATVKIANVYDTICKDTTKDLVVEKDGQTFIGALFFKQEEWDKIEDTVESTEVDGTAFDIMMAAYELKKKHGLLAKDDKTLTTMMHWQFINGLTDEMLDGYGYENDTAYLASIQR